MLKKLGVLLMMVFASAFPIGASGEKITDGRDDLFVDLSVNFPVWDDVDGQEESGAIPNSYGVDYINPLGGWRKSDSNDLFGRPAIMLDAWGDDDNRRDARFGLVMPFGKGLEVEADNQNWEVGYTPDIESEWLKAYYADKRLGLYDGDVSESVSGLGVAIGEKKKGGDGILWSIEGELSGLVSAEGGKQEIDKDWGLAVEGSLYQTDNLETNQWVVSAAFFSDHQSFENGQDGRQSLLMGQIAYEWGGLFGLKCKSIACRSKFGVTFGKQREKLAIESDERSGNFVLVGLDFQFSIRAGYDYGDGAGWRRIGGRWVRI